MTAFKRFVSPLFFLGFGAFWGWFSLEKPPFLLGKFFVCILPFLFYWGLSSSTRQWKFLYGVFGYYSAKYSWLTSVYTPLEIGNFKNVVWVSTLLLAMWKASQFHWAVKWSRFPMEKTAKSLSVFIAFFVGFEWLQQWFFSGDLFYPLSSALLEHTFFYPLFACFGVYGVSLLYLSATLHPLFFPKTVGSYLVWLLVLAPIFVPRSVKTTGETKIALCQTDFPPFLSREVLQEQEIEYFHRTLRALKGKKIDCLVLSETRLPGRYLENNPFVERLKMFSKEENADILVGYLHTTPKGELTNATLLIHQGEIRGRYDKKRLVSLMEKRWSFLPESFLDVLGANDFFAGEKKVVLEGKFRYGVHICYDDYFGCDQWEWQHQNLDLIVSLHNDVWIQSPVFKWNHFRQSILRALEGGVPVVRATNSGVVGVVSPEGVAETFFNGHEVRIVQVLLEKTAPLYPIFQERCFFFYLFLVVVPWGMKKWFISLRAQQEEVDENAL